MTALVAVVEACGACGSRDLARFGHTQARTDADVTDVVECAECGWTLGACGACGHEPYGGGGCPNCGADS